MRPVVTVVQTGAANLASVRAALERLDAEVVWGEDPGSVRAADRLVLPGVGAFGPAAERLRRNGMADALVERISGGRPTLAVCLGMQLLAGASEESPGVPGLGLLPGTVQALPAGVPVPHLGWSPVAVQPEATLLRPGWACFAHGFALLEAPAGWSAAWSDHGGRFVAALQRGAVLACQFHPELSGAWGASLIRRWLALPAEEGAA